MTTDNQEQARPPTVSEAVFSRFREFAGEIFESFGEPKAAALVVDWGDLEGMPAGAMVIPRNTSVNYEAISRLYNRIATFNTRMLEEYFLGFVKEFKDAAGSGDAGGGDPK